MMAVINKDVVVVVSLVLSVVSLVLLFGVTWYFQSSLDLLQQQVEDDRELLFKLQEQINVSNYTIAIQLAICILLLFGVAKRITKPSYYITRIIIMVAN